MTEQAQREVTNLESCKRLQALSAYRQSQNELFQALTVLNDASFYLNPKGFESPFEHASEALQLQVSIWVKQVQLCLKMCKPQKSIPYMRQLLKNTRNDSTVGRLLKELGENGVPEKQVREETVQ